LCILKLVKFHPTEFPHKVMEAMIAAR
jgi:hypothetical protein